MASEHEHGDLHTSDEPDTQPPRPAPTPPRVHAHSDHDHAHGEGEPSPAPSSSHEGQPHDATFGDEHPHDTESDHGQSHDADHAHLHDEPDHAHPHGDEPDHPHPHGDEPDHPHPHDDYRHSHDNWPDHGHSLDDEPGHAHPHDGDHGHSHDDEPGHAYPHDGDHGHSLDDGGSGHGHSHDSGHGHAHDDDGSGHGHSHDSGHGHGDGHDHEHGSGLWARLTHLVAPHSHDTADKVDSALEGSREGMRALWLSLAGLGVTAVLQAVVVVWSGSVALLGDTLHNVADALTALPLALAFLVGRRPANRRYTYGYGRAEDLAGVFIVVVIAASSVIAGWQAVDRLLHPSKVGHLAAVAVAAVVGFVGNEAVARLRIRVGRRIGSAALVADGVHARTDGFTSLAVLVGAGGVAIGWSWADPVIGLVITVAILFVLKDAGREIYRRLMDAVDPALVAASEAALRSTSGVRDIGELRLRWVGHQLRAECAIVVDSGLSLIEAHGIAVEAEHHLLHEVPKLQAALVHADPAPDGSHDHHEHLSHHRP